MKARFLGLAAFAGAVLLSPICSVEACGPDFQPDVFVSTTSPDDPAEFAKGHLGILQVGFDSNDYAVAFRYLNGGKLSDAERQVYAPAGTASHIEADLRGMSTEQIVAEQRAEMQARQNASSPGRWLLERAKYLPAESPAQQKQSFPTDYIGNIVFDENYLNCPDPAFANATLALSKRADTWGKQSAWLTDWIRAQDAVFSNCAGKAANLPSVAPANSPALLKADRAYQIASAAFYAKQFDEAARQFEAIAQDKNSPWQRWGAYLAARATVRKAFAMGQATDPYSGDLASFDMDTMKRAQQMLETLLKEPNPAPSRTAIQGELNFIRIRTEPEKRVAEICNALAGPAPDPNFSQNLRDLSWVRLKRVNISNPPPLFAWISAWRSGGTAASAYATWQQTRSTPWLVMALVNAAPSDPFAADLLAAAAKVEKGTPAYDTVFFHRMRLLIAIDRKDEARTLLDEAIPALSKQKPNSNLNALLGERMAVARNFAEFLTYAPRTVLRTSSEGADDLGGQCNERKHAVNAPADCPDVNRPLQFDDDAVTVLNQQTPMRLLIEAASSPSLPANLREQIATIAWTRTVLLEDSASATKLAPLVPKAIRDIAGASIGFQANLAILRNPGIRPYLESGIPRVASYSYFDDLRDNWWCKPWDGQEDRPGAKPKDLTPPPFIPAVDEALASSEYSRLQQLPDSVAIIGRRVVDYATKHPDDPLVPESLALTVRAGHYACQSDNASAEPGKSEYTEVSKAAFQLLHRRYPKSSWATKTRYYY